MPARVSHRGRTVRESDALDGRRLKTFHRQVVSYLNMIYWCWASTMKKLLPPFPRPRPLKPAVKPHSVNVRASRIHPSFFTSSVMHKASSRVGKSSERHSSSASASAAAVGASALAPAAMAAAAAAVLPSSMGMLAWAVS